MVSVEDALTVLLPDSPLPVLLHPIQIVGEHKFIKIAKGDHKIIRLLTSSASPNERALTNTTAIETLIDQRNKVRQELMSPRDEKQQLLGIESAPACKRQKVSDMVLPEMVELKVPAIEGIGITSMRVLLTKAGSPLSIEASGENIDYLRAAIAQQASDTTDAKPSSAPGDCTEPSEHIEIPSAGPGITFVKSRQAYRVRYQRDGQTKWKDFRAASLEAHDLIAASQQALAFQQGES